MDNSKVISFHDFGPIGFRWLTLKRITWSDSAGITRFWESAERTTRRGAVDAVAIIARVSSRSAPPKVIIVSQFRPPLNAHCLELPAGLIDEGEGPETAALRELKEETGYTGTVISTSDICSCDPGMSNANMQIVVVDIDLDSPENQNIQQNLHDGECIVVELAPWSDLHEWLMKKKASGNFEIDARLLSFAIGIEQENIIIKGNDGVDIDEFAEAHQESRLRFEKNKNALLGFATGIVTSFILTFFLKSKK